ncbi:MAG: hypothetical protein WC807_09740 [Hyphomicrobium sp.]|jgi:hypothetical protein
MSFVSDERLMAFADGELSPEETRALEIMLAEDLDLAARLEPFRLTGAPLASVFGAALSAPVPERLLTAIKAHRRARLYAGKKNPALRSGLLDELFGGLRFASGLKPSHAFALSAVLVGSAIAWSATQLTSTNTDPALASFGAGVIVASGPLSDALEKMQSSTVAAAPGITPVATFAKEDGGYCREYRMTTVGGATYAGVACRELGGPQWRIAAHVEVPPTKPQAKSTYTTASGPQTAAVNAVVAAMMAGSVLEPADEVKLIAKGWMPKN